jgi:acetyl-CoA carboxylase carboxyltransferase component
MSVHRNHDDRLAELRRRNEEAEAGGGAERYARLRKEGKLGARERIELLLRLFSPEEGVAEDEEDCQDPDQGADLAAAAYAYFQEGELEQAEA